MTCVAIVTGGLTGIGAATSTMLKAANIWREMFAAVLSKGAARVEGSGVFWITCVAQAGSVVG
jgi:hypothetical protein